MGEKRKNNRIIKFLTACFLALIIILMNLTGAIEVFSQRNLNLKAEKKTEVKDNADGIRKEETNESKIIENAKPETDDLDLGDEIVGEAVRGTIKVKVPTITRAFIGENTISGGNLQRARIGGKTVRGTVHVTLKDSNGNEKATVSVTPTSGTIWKVNLPDGVTIAKGDTVTAYQELNGNKSPVTDPVDAKPSLAGQNNPKMPTGEIWIEQPDSNIVNDDEQAEAFEMLKNANPDIANDFDPKKTKFSIDGTDHAYYEVTYTDDSTLGKVEATNLIIKTVTEYSRAATLGSITIVDNVIKGQLSGEGPFDGIKVQILLKLSDAVKGSYCDGGKCLVDKDTSKPVDATVDGKTGKFSYTIPNPNLELDQKVGVTVKEPHKFKSCSQATVQPVKVEKTEVKDPRKLTAKDKEAIDAAIRKAYTAKDGTSKLPNGTGDWKEVPAVIQIDDSGNTKIFSGNDVAGDWDPNNNYKFVPETNEDGSVKIKDGAEPKITILAKDLLKNIKPDAPAVALSEDKKNITITPNEKDTDASSISVSYTGKDGSTKTTKATKADDGTWSISEGEGSVDQNGVVTLPKDKVKGKTVVTATVTDKGGIAEEDITPLTSEPGTLTVKETKADKVEALGGLDPVALKKWVGDEVNWKDGVKASDSATEENKGKINELLKEAKTSFADTTRNTNSEGDFTGTIKVTFDDGSSIEVKDQKLYVSNHVTSMDRKDKVPTDALDVELKLGEGTKVDNTDGNKDNPVSYIKYKVKTSTNLKEYKFKSDKSVFDSINLTAQDGYTEPVWKNSQNGDDFVATDSNKVFTATATKTYDITFDANSGTGNKDKETVKKDSTYNLPSADTFTAPENMQFSGWQVGEDSQNLKNAGDQITITDNVNVKAIWKPIELKVNFLPGIGASGEMKDAPVNKGSDYELPKPTFKAPENKVFAGWKVGNEDGVKKAGEIIKITDNVTLTATWKDIMVNISYDANGGSGEMTGKELKKGSTIKLPDNEFTAPENKIFDGWLVNGEDKKVGDEITVNGDTTVTAKWKPLMVDVSFDKGEGSGSKEKVSVAKGSEYTLPDSEGFTAPENKEFAGWKLEDGTIKKAGDKIENISGNVTLTATWKDIKYKITFDGNTGTGSMNPATVKKGEKYKLPDNTFGAPSDKQEFKAWEVDGKEVAPGTEITINKDTEVKALWKEKTTTPGTPGTPETPGTDENETPQPGKPKEPKTPEDPKTPDKPKTPEDLKTPDKPKTPEDPKLPDKPKEPQIPEVEMKWKKEQNKVNKDTLKKSKYFPNTGKENTQNKTIILSLLLISLFILLIQRKNILKEEKRMLKVMKRKNKRLEISKKYK